MLVASAFELRREVGVEHRHGLVVGDEAGREDDNVGVVVTADERCDLRFPRQSGADALMFVEGHGHPFARTAEGDAAFEFAFLDRFGQRVCVVGIIDAFGGAGAEVVDVVTHGREVAHQKFFHFVAGVIAGDTYFSHRIFVFVLFLGSVIQR